MIAGSGELLLAEVGEQRHFGFDREVPQILAVSVPDLQAGRAVRVLFQRGEKGFADVVLQDGQPYLVPEGRNVK